MAAGGGEGRLAKDLDDIEYYLKLPTPPSSPPSSPPSLTSSSVVDDFVLVHNDEAKPPAVILLGWAGCQDKHLAKYGNIYSDKGCVTLRCTAPLGSLFLRRRRMRELGRRLLDELLDLNLNEHPIFFHVFSNGGAYLYKHVVLAMQERTAPAAPLRVLGVVWDSAPGERRFRSMYLALRAILEWRWPALGPRPRWPRLGAPLAWALALLMTALWVLEVLVLALASLTPQPLDPLAGLRNAPSAYTGAHLFLYSPADELILAEDVERFARHRRGMGELVTAVRFADSAHVQHYIAHKEAYTEAIYAFMRDALSGRRPSPT